MRRRGSQKEPCPPLCGPNNRFFGFDAEDVGDLSDLDGGYEDTYSGEGEDFNNFVFSPFPSYGGGMPNAAQQALKRAQLAAAAEKKRKETAAAAAAAAAEDTELAALEAEMARLEALQASSPDGDSWEAELAAIEKSIAKAQPTSRRNANSTKDKIIQKIDNIETGKGWADKIPTWAWVAGTVGVVGTIALIIWKHRS